MTPTRNLEDELFEVNNVLNQRLLKLDENIQNFISEDKVTKKIKASKQEVTPTQNNICFYESDNDKIPLVSEIQTKNRNHTLEKAIYHIINKNPFYHVKTEIKYMSTKINLHLIIKKKEKKRKILKTKEKKPFGPVEVAHGQRGNGFYFFYIKPNENMILNQIIAAEVNDTKPFHEIFPIKYKAIDLEMHLIGYKKD